MERFIKKNTKLTPLQADRTLKALFYLHHYAPHEGTDVPDNSLKLYYPGATLNLRDGNQRILWNAKGYDFTKTRQRFGNGKPGRSYYFLRTIFSEKDHWKRLTKPSSEELAPYRDFLSFNQPYFCSHASDVVLLFGKLGGARERKSLHGWANKQKASIDPNMDWKTQCHDFGSQLKVNIINFTRSEFEATVKEIIKLGKRLDLTEQELKEDKALEKDVTDVHALVKKEKEADIMRHPQPLRDLVRANRNRNDPDLKTLKTAIEEIRKKPDPKLFKQLASELDDGTVEMSSLLKKILIDEHDSLGLTPWGQKEKTIAVHACIDALPIAKEIGEMRTLVETILMVCGGGKIAFQNGKRGTSLEVKIRANGKTVSSGGAVNPLSMEDTQKELKRLYLKSKQK